MSSCFCRPLLWFNGIDTCVQTSAPALCEPSLWSDALTVGCIFRSADISGGCLINITNPHGYFKLFILDGSLRAQLHHPTTDQYVVVCTPNSTLRQSQWYHVTFTWDLGPMVKIYLDGVQVQVQVMALGDKRLWEAPPPLACPHTNESDVGSYTIGHGFSGFIKHVRIWRVAMSTAEIVEHVEITGYDEHFFLEYTSPGLAEKAADMVAHWPLLDGEGHLAHCESGITAHPVPPAEILHGSWYKEREKRYVVNETEQKATWPRDRPMPVPDANVTVLWEGCETHYSAVNLGPIDKEHIRDVGIRRGRRDYLLSIPENNVTAATVGAAVAPASRRRVLFVKQGTSNISLCFHFQEERSNWVELCMVCTPFVYMGMQNGFSAQLISCQHPKSVFRGEFSIKQNHLPGAYYITQQMSCFIYANAGHVNDFKYAIALVHVLPRTWRPFFSRLPFEIRQEIKIMLFIRDKLRRVSNETEDGDVMTETEAAIPAYGRVPDEVLYIVFDRLIDAWCDM